MALAWRDFYGTAYAETITLFLFAAFLSIENTHARHFSFSIFISLSFIKKDPNPLPVAPEEAKFESPDVRYEAGPHVC